MDVCMYWKLRLGVGRRGLACCPLDPGMPGAYALLHGLELEDRDVVHTGDSSSCARLERDVPLTSSPVVGA
eukprot:11142392-Heterocapsa_arctica.AAC.1